MIILVVFHHYPVGVAFTQVYTTDMEVVLFEHAWLGVLVETRHKVEAKDIKRIFKHKRWKKKWKCHDKKNKKPINKTKTCKIVTKLQNTT